MGRQVLTSPEAHGADEDAVDGEGDGDGDGGGRGDGGGDGDGEGDGVGDGDGTGLLPGPASGSTLVAYWPAELPYGLYML